MELLIFAFVYLVIGFYIIRPHTVIHNINISGLSKVQFVVTVVVLTIFAPLLAIYTLFIFFTQKDDGTI